MAQLGSRLSILHMIAVMGRARQEDLMDRLDLAAGEARRILELAANEKLLDEKKGFFELSGAGFVLLAQEYPHSFIEERGDQELARLADALHGFDGPVTSLMERWQSLDLGSTMIANDHSDPDHDALLIGRVRQLFAKVEPMLAELAVQSPHFEAYAGRFQQAFRRIDHGSPLFVDGRACESFHRLWQELRRDLDLVLGRRDRPDTLREEHG